MQHDTKLNQTGELDFSNTAIAFGSKSQSDLKETYQLFRLMNNSALVKASKPLINLAFGMRLPIQGIIKRTIYRHFVGGETIEECGQTVHKLAENRVQTILDYAVEGEESDQLFDDTCDEVIRTIEYADKHRDVVPFSVFKITGVGRFDLLVKVSENEKLTADETEEYRRVLDRVDRIFGMGHQMNVPILIDAEETWIQPMLDDLVLEMMRKYNKERAIVQNTYQMYRHDSLERIKKHHAMMKEAGFKFGLKIVRGAYMEKERARAAEKGYPSPIQPDKPATDADYDAAIRYLVQNHDSIDFMIATHNEKSTRLLAQLIDESGLPKNKSGIFFAQLYGMSDNLTYNLASAGYNVAKYVPYGAVRKMMPYLLRRAEENSSVKGQTSRELQLITDELKRRKHA